MSINLAEPLAQHARARPDKPALRHGDRAITYRELNDLVCRSAAHLLDRGVREGEVVALALADTIEHVVLLFALARAGIVMLPLDWRWPPPIALPRHDRDQATPSAFHR